jgi:hypothetical protein
MPMTLVEYAKENSGDIQKSAIVEMFARQSDILANVPLETITGQAVKYNREGSLPGVAFRGVNESYTSSTGVINPITDSVFIVGGDIDVDRFLVQTQGGQRRATEISMKVKAIADAWAQKFIKGDSSTEPREFDGLQTRLTGAQVVDAGATSGGDALSIAKLQETIDAVDDPTHLLMSKAMRRLLTTASTATSVSGYLAYDKDAFGRRVTRFADLPILVTNSGSTEPLGFTEANPGGGTAASTSIYVVSLRLGRLNIIQNGGMDVRDLGEIDSAPVFRTRVEWYAGLAVYHGRAAARLRGIKSAAVVA